jgi:drug/metabolite transporter (DMT)-like permease
MSLRDLVAVVLIVLGAFMVLVGLGDAAFGDHLRGLIVMIGGAIIFDRGTALYSAGSKDV